MKYQCSDAGRATSKRPKQKRDCVIRAIALAFDLPYDAVYDLMAGLGRKCSTGTPKKIWQGWLDQKANKISFPAIAGQSRMSLERFADQTTGRYVVQMAGHLCAVIDGVIYDDSYPRSQACVYAVWEVKN